MRGHQIFFDEGTWKYLDDGSKVCDNRPCARCGNFPTKEGYDFCLGFIPGVLSACCGHGVEKAYFVKE